MIEDAEKSAIAHVDRSEFEKSSILDDEHQNNQIQQLYNKYQKIGEEVRKSA